MPKVHVKAGPKTRTGKRTQLISLYSKKPMTKAQAKKLQKDLQKSRSPHGGTLERTNVVKNPSSSGFVVKTTHGKMRPGKKR